MSHDTDDVDDSEMVDRTADTDEPPTTVRHSWEQTDHPSMAIVEAVAAATDRSTTDLSPLQQQIDPDALDALLTHRPSAPIEVSFTYAGSAISVTGDGTIEVHIDSSPTGENGE